MPYAVIRRYTLSAALFALAVSGLWLAARLLFVRRRWERRDWLRLAAVAYLAAVVQIIGLRLGLKPIRLLGGSIHLRPLQTTIRQWRKGRGAFLYHTAGNVAWFLPLGLLLPRMWPRCRWFHALLAGALLSFCVEACQYLLGTGMSDVDDILLNALGAWIGYGMDRRFRHPAK